MGRPLAARPTQHHGTAAATKSAEPRRSLRRPHWHFERKRLWRRSALLCCSDRSWHAGDWPAAWQRSGRLLRSSCRLRARRRRSPRTWLKEIDLIQRGTSLLPRLTRPPWRGVLGARATRGLAGEPRRPDLRSWLAAEPHVPNWQVARFLDLRHAGRHAGGRVRTDADATDGRSIGRVGRLSAADAAAVRERREG